MSALIFDTASNFHPYECDGKGKCPHCDLRLEPGHDPTLCALCDVTVPYPGFCRHPARCHGKSSCQNDPSCVD